MEENIYRTYAERILIEHTEAYLCAIFPEEDIKNMTLKELHELIYSECSHHLARDWMDGKITIREYFNIRNELAKLLNEILERDLTFEEYDKLPSEISAG